MAGNVEIETKKKVYLSGPMSGVLSANKPLFDEYKALVTSLGMDSISPPDMDLLEPAPPGWKKAMRRDIRALMDCDYIMMLPGWERSEGAKIEKGIADSIGIPTIDEEGKEITTRSVLIEAEDLIGGDRQASYGHPREDFKRTAGLWTAYLGTNIKVEDVPMLMVLLKVSREKNRHKRDNIVDICGYAGTSMMLYD